MEVKEKKTIFEDKVKNIEEDKRHMEREQFRLGLLEKNLEERLRNAYDEMEHEEDKIPVLDRESEERIRKKEKEKKERDDEIRKIQGDVRGKERKEEEGMEDLKEEQSRFMQNVKRIMGQRWDSIQRALYDGKEVKKRAELGKARDLERKLQNEMDRLIEWKSKEMEREKQRDEEMEEYERDLYEEIMNENLKIIEEHKANLKGEEEELKKEIEDLKKNKIMKEEELRESEDKLSNTLIR